jgi:hypothetical protein
MKLYMSPSTIAHETRSTSAAVEDLNGYVLLSPLVISILANFLLMKYYVLREVTIVRNQKD